MNIINRKYIWSLAFYIWCAGILVLTTMPFSSGTRQPSGNGIRFDYLEHFILFFAVPILYYLSRGAWLTKLIRDPYYLFLIGLLFSVLTEIQQYQIPGRSFNYIDLLLNLSGYLSGVLLYYFVLRKFTPDKEKKDETNPD